MDPIQSQIIITYLLSDVVTPNSSSMKRKKGSDKIRLTWLHLLSETHSEP